jgi:hypothetical protein
LFDAATVPAASGHARLVAAAINWFSFNSYEEFCSNKGGLGLSHFNVVSKPNVLKRTLN